jgi:hypothetical protein
MQLPPITFGDVSMLLAMSAVLLLLTTELVSSYSGQTTLIINKKKLRIVALAMGMSFLVTVAITMMNIISNLQP